jgi:hypothetical protein
MAAPVFNAVAETASATAANLTLTVPPGAVVGGTALALVYKENNTAPGVPSGWTLIHEINPDTNHSAHLYWARVTAGGAADPGSTHQWTFGSIFRGGGVWAFNGTVPTGDPQDVAATENSSTTGQVITVNGLTTLTPDCRLVYFVTHWAGGDYSTPAGYLEHTDAVGWAVGSKALPSAGAESNFTVTCTGASDSWSAFLVALKPAATIEQEGFRFYTDAASPVALAAQDAGVTREEDTNTLVRMLVNANSDPEAGQHQLEYRVNGGRWRVARP